MIAVTAPPGLHDVGLRHLGRQAGTRSTAHDVHDDQGDLGHGRETDVLEFEGYAGTAAGRQGLATAQGSPEGPGHRGNLVFHLDELAADLRQLLGEYLGYLGRGGDGIAREELGPSCERSEGTGFIAVPQYDFARFHETNTFSLTPSLGRIDLDGHVGTMLLALLATRALLAFDESRQELVVEFEA